MPARRKHAAPPEEGLSDLRIIGGRYRGTKLVYEPHRRLEAPAAEGSAGLVTRPMKHRVREAIFNLIGTELEGKHAVDVFAGTGALGLEALSRGATSATFIERHVPTAKVVEANIAAIDAGDCCELLVTSAFVWSRRDLPNTDSSQRLLTTPWAAFVSPPYDFYVEREAEMLDLVALLERHAPAESLIVVEADERFDFAKLGVVKQARADTGWDVRTYTPAVVGVWRKAPETGATE